MDILSFHVFVPGSNSKLMDVFTFLVKKNKKLFLKILLDFCNIKINRSSKYGKIFFLLHEKKNENFQFCTPGYYFLPYYELYNAME